jgi:hypothetical protein
LNLGADLLQKIASPGKSKLRAGLPDGLFSNQKSHFGLIFEGLRLENVDIFYGHLEYLRNFWIFYDHWVHFVIIWYIFFGFGIMYQEKSGNPGCEARKKHPEAKSKENSCFVRLHFLVCRGARERTRDLFYFHLFFSSLYF